MTLLPFPTQTPSSAEPGEQPRARQSWKDKFKVAFRGIKFGIRGHSSFAVHFFFTALVFMAALVARCSLFEWAMLIGSIGFVLTAELFNSAIETLFRGLDEPTKSRTWPALDIAAGAVLLASITSCAIGTIIFLPKLAAWFNLL